MDKYQTFTKDELINEILRLDSEVQELRDDLKQARLREKILERFVQANLPQQKQREWQKYKKDDSKEEESHTRQLARTLRRTRTRTHSLGDTSSPQEPRNEIQISTSTNLANLTEARPKRPEKKRTLGSSMRSSYMNFDKHLLGYSHEDTSQIISDFYTEWKEFQSQIAQAETKSKLRKYYAAAFAGLNGWTLYTLCLDLEENSVTVAKGKLAKDPLKMKWKDRCIDKMERIVTEQNLLRLTWDEDEDLVQFQSPTEREDFFGRVRKMQTQLKKTHSCFYEINHPTKLKVLCGTWNMGNTAPPDDLSAWLIPGFDIYAIGVQENSKLSNQEWTNALEKYFGRGYVRLGGGALWAIKLNIFVKISLSRYISNVESSTTATGIAKVGGNKGGVGCSFRFKDTSFCFVNCHLAAHQDHVDERNEHFKDIARYTDVGRTNYGLFDQFQHLFWFGDLNYRLDAERGQVLKHVASKNFGELAKVDQLAVVKKKGQAFSGFHESEIKFYPTYKITPNSDAYDDKKGRVPSWCDRILFRSLGGVHANLTPMAYDSARKIRTSDHHPVFASFEIGVMDDYVVDPNRQSVPTSIYLSNLYLQLQTGKKKPLTTASKLSLMFFSTFAENKTVENVSFRVLQDPSALLHNSGSGSKMGESQRHSLSCFWDQIDLLQAQSLLVGVYLQSESIQLFKTGDRKKIAQGHINLANTAKAAKDFQIPVHNGTKAIGILMGTVKLSQLIEQ